MNIEIKSAKCQIFAGISPHVLGIIYFREGTSEDKPIITALFGSGLSGLGIIGIGKRWMDKLK